MFCAAATLGIGALPVALAGGRLNLEQSISSASIGLIAGLLLALASLPSVVELGRRHVQRLLSRTGLLLMLTDKDVYSRLHGLGRQRFWTIYGFPVYLPGPRHDDLASRIRQCAESFEYCCNSLGRTTYPWWVNLPLLLAGCLLFGMLGLALVETHPQIMQLAASIIVWQLLLAAIALLGAATILAGNAVDAGVRLALAAGVEELLSKHPEVILDPATVSGRLGTIGPDTSQVGH